MNITEFLNTYNEYQELGISEQIDYGKFYLYSLITHSTAIEGSTITEIENQLMFDNDIVPRGRSLQELFMNNDLRCAYEYAIRQAKTHCSVSIPMLCDLSAMVMKNTGSVVHAPAGTFDVSKGELRKVNVTAGGGRSYMSFLKVPQRLAQFCQDINERLQRVGDNVIEQYELSFDAHNYLVAIHPWCDGNGRMARLLMNYVQLYFDLVPARIDKSHKAEYIRALVASRETESPMPFREFMFAEHCNNLRQEIEHYKRDTEEEDYSQTRIRHR